MRWIFPFLSTFFFAVSSVQAQISPLSNTFLECASKDIELEREGFGVLQADSLETDDDNNAVLMGVCFTLEGFDFVAQKLEVRGQDLTATTLKIAGDGVAGTALSVRNTNGVYALEGLSLNLTLPNARLGTVPLEGSYTLTSSAAELKNERLSVKAALLERPNSDPLERYALENAEIGRGFLKAQQILVSRSKLNVKTSAVSGQLEPLEGSIEKVVASYCRIPNAGELDFSLERLNFDAEKVRLSRLEGRFFGLPFLSLNTLEFGMPGILSETLNGTGGAQIFSSEEGTVPPLEFLTGQNTLYGVRHLPVTAQDRLSGTLESLISGAKWNLALERGSTAARARIDLNLEPRDNNLGLTLDRDLPRGFQARAAANSSLYKFSGFEAGYGWTLGKIKTDLLAGIALENSQTQPFFHARLRYPLEWVSGRLSVSGSLEAHGYGFGAGVYGALEANFKVRSRLDWGTLELGEQLKIGAGNSRVTAFKVEPSSATALTLTLQNGKIGPVLLEEPRLSYALETDLNTIHSSRLGGSVRLLPLRSSIGVTPELGYDFAQNKGGAALELNVFSECFSFNPKVGLEWKDGVSALKLGFSVRLR